MEIESKDMMSCMPHCVPHTKAAPQFSIFVMHKKKRKNICVQKSQAHCSHANKRDETTEKIIDGPTFLFDGEKKNQKRTKL